MEFSDEDMVISRNQDGVKCGGYNINSSFLENETPVALTQNTNDFFGGNGVPVGLYLKPIQSGHLGGDKYNGNHKPDSDNTIVANSVESDVEREYNIEKIFSTIYKTLQNNIETKPPENVKPDVQSEVEQPKVETIYEGKSVGGDVHVNDQNSSGSRSRRTKTTETKKIKNNKMTRGRKKSKLCTRKYY